MKLIGCSWRSPYKLFLLLEARFSLLKDVYFLRALVASYLFFKHCRLKMLGFRVILKTGIHLYTGTVLFL